MTQISKLNFPNVILKQDWGGGFKLHPKTILQHFHVAVTAVGPVHPC
jgi:hypothetical protein